MWDGYLNDCTGWASEAISFVYNLERVRGSRRCSRRPSHAELTATTTLQPIGPVGQMLSFLAIVGDASFCPGYPPSVETALHRLRQVSLPDEV